jgi:hypothetical protein
LETYPATPRLTQKNGWNNTPQYPIPNDYVVETELAKWSFRCETKYISSLKVRFTIIWKEGRAEYSVSSTKSSTAVVNAYLQV